MEILNFETSKKSYRLGKNGPVVELDIADDNIPIRMSEAINNIKNFIESEFENVGIKDVCIDNITELTTGSIESDIELLKKADKYTKSQVDYVFGYEVSKVVFGNVSSLSVDSRTGERYYEKLFNAFIPVLNKEYNASISKLKANIKKYTDRKGLHPALRK